VKDLTPRSTHGRPPCNHRILVPEHAGARHGADGRQQYHAPGGDPIELILSPAPEPVRVPAADIDTIWTRGSSTKTGLIVGALLGAGLGIVAGSTLGEADTPRGELMGATIGLGMAGGGLLGALFGTAVPRWKRGYP
jgi:hypothetical protein